MKAQEGGQGALPDPYLCLEDVDRRKAASMGPAQQNAISTNELGSRCPAFESAFRKKRPAPLSILSLDSKRRSLRGTRGSRKARQILLNNFCSGRENEKTFPAVGRGTTLWEGIQKGGTSDVGGRVNDSRLM